MKITATVLYNLKVEKINIFTYRILKYYFTQTAHNGGNSLIDNILVSFMKDIKNKITNEKICSQASTNEQHMNTDCENYRAPLLNSQSLTYSDLEKQFKTYIQGNTSLSNENEIINFIDLINNDISFFENRAVTMVIHNH